MDVVVHGGMVLSSACGLGCSTLLARRARLTAIAAGLVMLGAMIDMSAGQRLMTPPSWAAVLILTAIATTTAQLGLLPTQPTMALHRGLGAVVVAALLLATHSTSRLSMLPPLHAMTAMGGTAATTSGAPAHPGVSADLIAGGLAVAYVVVSVLLAVHHARTGRTLDHTRPDARLRRARIAARIEIAAMGACIILMSIDSMAAMA